MIKTSIRFRREAINEDEKEERTPGVGKKASGWIGKMLKVEIWLI